MWPLDCFAALAMTVELTQQILPQRVGGPNFLVQTCGIVLVHGLLARPALFELSRPKPALSKPRDAVSGSPHSRRSRRMYVRGAEREL